MGTSAQLTDDYARQRQRDNTTRCVFKKYKSNNKTSIVADDRVVTCDKRDIILT